MKRLNGREQIVAAIASDLFLKGTPEWRVAKYGFDKGFTEQQFSNFLDKIPASVLSEETKHLIHTHFKDLTRAKCYDKAKGAGEKLAKWLESNKS